MVPLSICISKRFFGVLIFGKASVIKLPEVQLLLGHLCVFLVWVFSLQPFFGGMEHAVLGDEGHHPNVENKTIEGEKGIHP